jgi:hypothetical protein
MKKIHISIIALLSLVFSSCNKDEEASPPEVTLIELGYNNSKTGYPGEEFHIEAEVVAEGKIDRIEVGMHLEGEHTKMQKSLKDDHWHFDTTYTEFQGLKNTVFHKHIMISAEADTGHYHFHFKVTDMEGNQTEKEAEIEIIYP